VYGQPGENSGLAPTATGLPGEAPGPSATGSIREVNDDWRVHARLPSEADARELVDGLEHFELAHELGSDFRQRVMVSRDDADVFLYAGSREQAQRALAALQAVAAQHRWSAQSVIHRWHPRAEEWEDPERPLPADPAAEAQERGELIAQERRESAEQGYPDFEVRVRCPSRREAVELAGRLVAEGIPCAQRWQFVAVGAPDQDTAAALAERLRGQVPPGSELRVEGSVMKVVDEAPFATPFNPFAVFGGFGG
jgi:hypothetical protein